MTKTVVSVSQLNGYVKSILSSDHILSGILVRGEISNFTCHFKSGHMYFTLKDEAASVKSVMFKGYAQGLKFEPKNGMAVIVSGSVSLYERDGSYQLYVTDMQPDGLGALHLAYEQLKEKLFLEGLLDPQRKKPLPQYPMRIGIVTSEGAAALQDMLNILGRRWPVATVVLCPAQVQGEGAAKTIADGIRRLNAQNACDVMIIGRGGGSIEDLWAFNDEALARVIAASGIPVISAVGHETDFTIADLVADLRAPTPSAAAELVSPDIEDLRDELEQIRRYIADAVPGKIERLQAYLDNLRLQLHGPEAVLEMQSQKLSYIKKELDTVMKEKLARTQEQIGFLRATVEGASPIRIFEKGYGVVHKDTVLVKSVSQLQEGDEIAIRLADGQVLSQVQKIEGNKNGKRS